MNKEEAKNLPKYTPNQLLKDLPDFLKDPANYNKIQKDLIDCLAGKHSHSEMIGWAQCLECQGKMADLRNKINKYGFTSPNQYFAWKKVMDVITGKTVDQKVKLKKYND
jgi:hypothetical protein